MDDTEKPVPNPSLVEDSLLEIHEESVPDHGDPESQPLSKKAIKKAAKAERLAALKIERRAREKEARKEKKRIIAAKRAAGELDPDEDEKNRQKKKPRIHWGGTVVLDLGFDEMMTEKVCVARLLRLPRLVTCPGYRRSNLCAPNWRIPIVQIATQHTHSRFCTHRSMVARLPGCRA